MGKMFISSYMNIFWHFRECFCRAFTRKKTLLVFGIVAAVSLILGMIFVTTPAMYDYHLTICDRFVRRVCFSDRSVFEIFLERALGHALLLLVVLFSGIHVAGCVLPPVVFVYRAYTLGGSLYIFFSVYRFAGALIALGLYLPVHLAVDFLLCCAGALSYARAPHFCFSKHELFLLLLDFALLLVLLLAVGLVEMLLLLTLFHPMGNIS